MYSCIQVVSFNSMDSSSSLIVSWEIDTYVLLWFLPRQCCVTVIFFIFRGVSSKTNLIPITFKSSHLASHGAMWVVSVVVCILLFKHLCNYICILIKVSMNILYGFLHKHSVCIFDPLNTWPSCLLIEQRDQAYKG